MVTELPLYETFEKLGIALGLGLLVGLQRQRSDSSLAGVRTFPLVTVFGTLAGLLSAHFGGWILAAAFVGFGAVIAAGYAGHMRREGQEAGLTTEMAMLVMFGVGAYLVPGHNAAALFVAGTLTVLLHLKPEMHSFAQRLGEKDFRAIMQFVLITLVILPALPDRAYGPYQVLNPFKIWLLVVLIVGISFGGYVVYKFLDAKKGSILSGVLGGFISSTATTVSYARRTKNAPESAPMAALVLVIASTVLFVRVLFVVGVVAPAHFLAVAGPVSAFFVAMTLISTVAWMFGRNGEETMPRQENPTELKPAIFFAALFAIVLVATAAAKEYFGSQGLYVVSVISGLTDVDAITLSGLQMLNQNSLDAGMAWRMIIIASLANLVFKGATVAVLGHRKLFARIFVLFGLSMAAGLAILWLWP